MKRLLCLTLAGGFLTPGIGLAQPVLNSEDGEKPELGSGTDRVLATADQQVKPDFAIWQDDRFDGFIKPIVQMSSSVVGYLPESDRQQSEFNNRVSTLLLARIGFEGQLFEFLTFRTLFERNIGFSLRRNGPVGTSIWEGTASWQARENYIRLSKWGFSLTAGILPDPASVDFISENILDSFGMDPYVRDPLLVSGFNQGQAVLLRYSRWGFTAGAGFTGGNPLVSSLSFGFGGQVNQNSDLFNAPLRALSNGIPGSDIHMNLFTPSLSYANRFFAVRTAGQFYWIDNDVTEDEDAQLTGFNLRATAKLNTPTVQYVLPVLLLFGDLPDDFLRLYGTAAYRENDTVAIPDITELRDERFKGIVASGGFDVDIGTITAVNLSVGGNYYYVTSRFTAESGMTGRPDDLTVHYINLGATYWLWQDVVSAGFRWARNMTEATQSFREPALDATDSFILSLRLLI